jgi:hypothetical protein
MKSTARWDTAVPFEENGCGFRLWPEGEYAE